MEEIYKNHRWHPTNSPVANSRTDDIWFRSEKLGWAVNSNGQILKTTDGGKSWTEQLRSPAYLRCIGFANHNIGWVGTTSNENVLYKTTDGGTDWNLVENLPRIRPAAICGLSVVDCDVIYCAGTNFPNESARMIKSTDGGRSWYGWEMGDHASLLVDTHFFSAKEGWVVGGLGNEPNPLNRSSIKPVVLYTSDGGTSWENRAQDLFDELPTGEWGWKIQFLDRNVGFVSLENFSEGAILKTEDGGKSWTRIKINDPQGNANLEGIGFLNKERGWVGGWGDRFFEGGYSSETMDGGRNWQDANHIGKFINRFRFVGDPPTVGYASGDRVYKFSDEPLLESHSTVAKTKMLLGTNTQGMVGEIELELSVPAGAGRIRVDVWDRFARHLETIMESVEPEPGLMQVRWRRPTAEQLGAPVEHFIFRISIDNTAESVVTRIEPSKEVNK